MKAANDLIIHSVFDIIKDYFLKSALIKINFCDVCVYNKFFFDINNSFKLAHISKFALFGNKIHSCKVKGNGLGRRVEKRC